MSAGGAQTQRMAETSQEKRETLHEKLMYRLNFFMQHTTIEKVRTASRLFRRAVQQGRGKHDD